jgi:hypothetical protein
MFIAVLGRGCWLMGLLELAKVLGRSSNGRWDIGGIGGKILCMTAFVLICSILDVVGAGQPLLAAYCGAKTNMIPGDIEKHPSSLTSLPSS